MVGVAVPSGDPVGGGHDVDTRFEHLHVQVFVGEHPVKGHHIRFGRDDLLDRAGGCHTVGRQAGDLTGIAADLLRCVAVQPDQRQIGVRANPFDHLGAHIAGGNLEDADLIGHRVSTFLTLARSAALPPRPSG
jgi:hypothetical protein